MNKRMLSLQAIPELDGNMQLLQRTDNVVTLQKPQRLELLDAARFIAALAIIWLHTTGITRAHPGIVAPWFGDSITRFAVPFFTFSAVAMINLSLVNSRPKSFGHYAGNRAKRILIPYAFWWVLYYLFINLKHLIHGTGFTDFHWGTVVSGPAHHMWYLPFIFMASIFAFVSIRALRQQSVGIRRFAAMIAFLAGIVLPVILPSLITQCNRLAAAHWGEEAVFGYFYLATLSVSTLPALLWGISAVLIWPDLINRVARYPIVSLSGLVVLIGSMIWIELCGRQVLVENIAGLAFAFVAFAHPKIPVARTLAKLGSYAFGIYISHVLFVLGIETALVKDRNTLELGKTIIIFFLASITSVITAVILKRMKWTSWIVP